ncbi:MAG: A1S_2505 family phage non-structural protein [Methylophilus sp.]|uniref:A1S_2505 family phage non-structural protein n=1 Tax=Methylophilus sp. TaxID=29541 RepID=UPI003FA16FD9
MGLVELYQSNGRTIALHGTVADQTGSAGVLGLYSDISALHVEYEAEDWESLSSNFKFVRKSHIHQGILFHQDMAQPTYSEVFVFGSNLKGRHGKGAALIAQNEYGAVYGVGKGFAGRSYALPTRDANELSVKKAEVRSLSLDEVENSISDFIKFAGDNLDKRFYVTRVGCTLAGFKDSDIGPLFKGVTGNCSLPIEWVNNFIEV